MKLTLTSTGINLDFQLSKKETTIGRADTCDWKIPSEKLSRNHCIFYDLKETQEFAILDPGSKNGIKVDGIRIEANKMVPVKSSSIIVLANELVLTFGNTVKIEMFDIAQKNISAPVKLKTKYDREKREVTQEKVSSFSLKSFIMKAFILSLALVASLTTFIYFYVYK